MDTLSTKSYMWSDWNTKRITNNTDVIFLYQQSEIGDGEEGSDEEQINNIEGRWVGWRWVIVRAQHSKVIISGIRDKLKALARRQRRAGLVRRSPNPGQIVSNI